MKQQRVARGNTLIEMLVVIAIIAILVGWLANRYAGKGAGTGGVRTMTPLQKAKSTDCGNNLYQVALALQMASAEHPPQDIREAVRHGAPESMLRCPDSHQPYRYDPRTGMLSCPTPGHESLARKVVGVE